jgi:CheY-like chemotaxis protein
MRILIADSDIDSLDVTAYALRREGFQVVTATTGADALLRWQNDRPHLLLVDAALPQGGGFEVCRRVRLKDDTPGDPGVSSRSGRLRAKAIQPPAAGRKNQGALAAPGAQ